MRMLAPFVALCLSACGQEEPQAVQRFSLDEARHVAEASQGSPDTADATWSVSQDGQAITFGKAGAPPLMTLACDLKAEPAQLTVIRHVAAQPRLKAMFPVIAGGKVARFPLDARLSGKEWRWEGALAAADPLNDVFLGSGELEATLPGGGSLLIGPSRIPAEFVTWCRAGGRLQRAQAADEAPTPAAAAAAVSATTPTTPTPSPRPTPRP